ncbi:MAG: hypothetical protein M3Q99_06695 [Acidobacteriota bacterium]|nr:hypothetical protein [Acidobacteriota bacterium]
MTKLKFDLLDDESAMETIETVGNLADENDIDWALAGGLAVILYGSDRLTKDVDIIASKKLPLKSEGNLVQGGERYKVKTAKRTVAVDWITRNDEAKKFYQQALKDAVMIADTPILTPEWLVILKYIAGRFKDQEDGVFLLRKKGLVNRTKVKEMIINIGSVETWAAFKSGLERWYDLADGRTQPVKEGYIDS